MRRAFASLPITRPGYRGRYPDRRTGMKKQFIQIRLSVFLMACFGLAAVILLGLLPCSWLFPDDPSFEVWTVSSNWKTSEVSGSMEDGSPFGWIHYSVECSREDETITLICSSYSTTQQIRIGDKLAIIGGIDGKERGQGLKEYYWANLDIKRIE